MSCLIIIPIHLPWFFNWNGLTWSTLELMPKWVYLKVNLFEDEENCEDDGTILMISLFLSFAIDLFFWDQWLKIDSLFNAWVIFSGIYILTMMWSSLFSWLKGKKKLLTLFSFTCTVWEHFSSWIFFFGNPHRVKNNISVGCSKRSVVNENTTCLRFRS